MYNRSIYTTNDKNNGNGNGDGDKRRYCYYYYHQVVLLENNDRMVGVGG